MTLNTIDMACARAMLLGLLATVLFACDSGPVGPPPYPPDQVPPTVLEAGDIWTYDVSVTQSPLDARTVDTIATIRAQMEVTDTSAQLGDRSGLVVVEVTTQDSPDAVDRTWYDQSPDSLVDVAHSRPPRVDWAESFLREKDLRTKDAQSTKVHQLARGLSGIPVLVRRRRALSAASRGEARRDSIWTRDDPRVVLKAPLREGQSWVSFRAPFLSKRTVDGRSTVETTAGTFSAVEVVETRPESSLRWSDYYAEEGLVRRVVTDTLTLRRPDGTVEGQAVHRESYDLISYND